MAETVISTITLDGGQQIRFEHARDASDEDIRRMSDEIVSKAYPERPLAPTEVVRPKPESFVQGVAEGIAKPLNNAARVLEAGADQIGIGDAISGVGAAMGMAPTVAAAEQTQQAASDASPYQGSAAGNFVGNVVGTLPTLAIPGGALAQGAASGALLTDERTPGGVIKDAVIGGIGGKVAEGVLKTAAARLNPNSVPRQTNLPENLQTLYDNGIGVSMGQAFRGSKNPVKRGLAAFEDRASGQPIIGDIITAGRRNTGEQFEAAAINRSLDPIGQTLPPDMKSGRRAVKYAGDRLSAAFEQVVPQIGRFQTDAQFVDDLAFIQEQAGEMLPERATQLGNILNGLGRFFKEDGTTLDGQALKSIETRLGDKIRKYSASPDADQQELGAALESARAAVRDLAGRAYPEQAERLAGINKGWASLVQVERAAGNSKGRVTPNGYSQAVKMSNDTVRRRGYSRGTALNQDLADAASDVLPSDIADSGTSGRWAQANLLGLATGAAQAIPYGIAAAATRAGRVPPPITTTGPISEAMSSLARIGGRYAAIPTASGIQKLRQ